MVDKKALLAFLVVLMVLTAGCGQRRQVKLYVTTIAKEVPTIQDVGREVGDIFQELKTQSRPKDLMEVAARLELASEKLLKQVEKLKESKQSAAAVPAPQPAKELETRLMDCYDHWIGLGEDMSKVCSETADSCRKVAGASGKDKLTELRSAGQELKVRLESLKKEADAARESSQELSEEFQRLQKIYGDEK